MGDLEKIEAKIEAARRKTEEQKIRAARANKVSSEEDYISKNAWGTPIGILKIPAEEI